MQFRASLTRKSKKNPQKNKKKSVYTLADFEWRAAAPELELTARPGAQQIGTLRRRAPG